MSGSLLQFKKEVEAVEPEYLVFPTKTLKDSTQKTIAVSSLTAKVVDHNGAVPQNADFSLRNPDKEMEKKVITYFQNYFDYDRLSHIIDGRIYSEALAAGSLITSRLIFLGNEIKNEAEIRYCVVDPILDAMCKIWSYSAQLEESVKEDKDQDETASSTTSYDTTTATPQRLSKFISSPATPAGKVLQTQVSRSRPDYVLYSLRNQENVIVALIIEAKFRRHTQSYNALAQLVGYYAALSGKHPVCPVPPVAFVITQDDVTPVMFPFCHYQGEKNNLLINAVSLPKFPIFSNGLINIDKLKYLLCLSSPPQQHDKPGLSPIILTGEETITREAAQGLFITHDQSLKKELEASNKELEASNKELEASNERVERKQKELEAANEEKKKMLQEIVDLRKLVARK